MTAHLAEDTSTCVALFAADQFVSVRLDSHAMGLSLIAVPGTADVLRSLAVAAIEAADQLDHLAASTEVTA
ncbi:hypothetical protein [Streptomyces lichenis]|uniref:Roadblock/LC7 domain-containing protein n=1 Tax=Streptomyces lichenis TaxID=2306967 RepID=A0ABT0IFX7_9ACTN|nr:hypothetical protein [Streptomyces lichenis]MCK8680224.1 hypothetical protein [Streptomyces lichenis]